MMLEDYGGDDNMGSELTAEQIAMAQSKMNDDRKTDPDFQAPHLQEGIPPVTCSFGKADYWDQRYRHNKETFEWYKDYHESKHIINQ